MNIPSSGVILASAGLYSLYMAGKLQNEIRYGFLFMGIFFEIVAYLIFRIYNRDVSFKKDDKK